MPKEEDFQAYNGLVHGLRLNRCQCTCLHERHDICWGPQLVLPLAPQSSDQELVNQVHNPDVAILYLGPKKSRVQIANQSKDLERRLALGEQPAGGFDMVVALVLRATPEKDNTSAGRAAKLQFNQLQVQVWGSYSERL